MSCTREARHLSPDRHVSPFGRPARHVSSCAGPALLIAGLLAFAPSLPAAGQSAAPGAGTGAPDAGPGAPDAAGAPDQDSASKAPKRCRIRVGSGGGRAGRTFSAAEILDLDLRVRFRDPGEHVLRLEVHAPSGHLYQTLTVPFSTGRSRAGAMRVDGFPRPLEVRRTEEVPSDGRAWHSLVVQLPVAGTPIVHSSLYGRWTARAFLDDEIEPCSRSRRFFIEP